MVRAKSNGFASSLHERELVDAWASDCPTPQESFLDIELADELRHDYLDSMDAESRNKLLCANEKVIKSLLKVATCFGQMLSVENIQGCLASLYAENLKEDLAHVQAGLLKSMALAVIRETKKSKNARKEWMQRLKDACGDVLLKKKFERDNSGNSLEAAADEAAPAPVAAGVRPPVVNPDEMDTLPFFPGGADETPGPAVVPAPGPEGLPLATSRASESERPAGQWNIGDGGVLCSAPVAAGDDEETGEPVHADPEEQQHGDEKDDEGEGEAEAEDHEAATDQQPPKRKSNPHNGPVYTVYMAFLEKARSRGIKHMDAVKLWRHSQIRAVLMDSIPEDERKRRRY